MRFLYDLKHKIYMARVDRLIRKYEKNNHLVNYDLQYGFAINRDRCTPRKVCIQKDNVTIWWTM